MGDFYFNPSKNSQAAQISDSSSPTPAEKPNLAALPRTKEKIEPTDSGVKLAIFPWKLDLYYKNNRQMFYDLYFDALKTSLKNYKNILLKYSYYEHDEFDNDVENIKSLFSVENSSLWTKKSFLAPFSPNLDEVMKIAAKINADLTPELIMRYGLDMHLVSVIITKKLIFGHLSITS